MNYKTVADLNQDILRNLHRIPRDVDVVVGVPRSGLLAANLLALALNLPLAEVEGFANGVLLGSGVKKRRPALDRPFGDLRHALLVEDSMVSGRSMDEACARLAVLPPSMRITRTVIYGLGSHVGSADIVLEVLSRPRIFDWNFMHHEVLGAACVEIDGVLCADPMPEENDDGKSYVGFLRDARPLHVPTRRIAALVTGRPEKYRAETEAWLARNGIAYERLVMPDLPETETRRRHDLRTAFKSAYFKASDAVLFIEGEQAQADRIARLSGKPVLCVADHRIHHAATGVFETPTRALVIETVC